MSIGNIRINIYNNFFNLLVFSPRNDVPELLKIVNLAACGGTFLTRLTGPPWRDLLGLNLYPSNILEVTSPEIRP